LYKSYFNFFTKQREPKMENSKSKKAIINIKIDKLKSIEIVTPTTGDQPLVKQACASEHLPKFDKLQDAQKLTNGMQFLILKSQLVNIGEPDRISEPGELSSEKTSENVPALCIDRDGEINQGNTREHFFKKEKYLKVFFGNSDSRFNENLGKIDNVKSYVYMVWKSAIKNKISDAIQNSIKFKQFLQAAEYVLLAYKHINTKLTLGVIRELKENQILEIPAIALSTADVFHKEIKFFESLDDKRLSKFKKSISELDNKSTAQIYMRINKYKQTPAKPTTDKPKKLTKKDAKTGKVIIDDCKVTPVNSENSDKIPLIISKIGSSKKQSELIKLLGLKVINNPKEININALIDAVEVFDKSERLFVQAVLSGMIIGVNGMIFNLKEKHNYNEFFAIVEKLFNEKDV